MGKKIIMVDGSARRKNTYSLLKQIENILSAASYEIEIINLFDYNLQDCIGCEKCVRQDECCLQDDIHVLIDKLKTADGLVFSSPVYMCSITSRFKTFADRLNRWVHKPDLAGIPLMFVSTTASSGMKQTKSFYQSYSAALGVRSSDFISRVGKEMANPVKKPELANFMRLLKEDKKDYPPKINEIIMFNVGKILASKSTGADHKYWEEKGWFKERYYFPCKMNPGKVLFSKFIYKMISKSLSG